MRGYLEAGVWIAGRGPNTMKGDSFPVIKKLDPSHKYILYVASVCPFAHSANIARILKGLEAKIDVVFVNDVFGEEGWQFGSLPDPVHPDFKFLHQVYTHSKKDYTGRVSVPVLYDVDLGTIASNESLEIIELFNDFGDGVDLLAPAKDESTAADFETLKQKALKFNSGVYMSGLSTNQQDYEQAANGVFDTLDLLEERLGSSRFLFGANLTLVDIRVFVTYLRFIFVYRVLFKLDKKPYTEYKNLNRFVREMYQKYNLKVTAPSMEGIKEGYYKNFVDMMNSEGIVPLGPDFDLDAKF